MRAPLPVNPRRTRRASAPQHHSETSTAATLLSHVKTPRPSSSSVPRKAPAQKDNAEAEVLCTNAGQTADEGLCVAERSWTRVKSGVHSQHCTLGVLREEKKTLEGMAVDAPSAAITRALSASLLSTSHAASDSEQNDYSKSKHGNKMDVDARYPFAPFTAAGPSVEEDAQIERVRRLLRQVALPFIDTHIIESFLLTPARALSTSTTPPPTREDFFTRNGQERTVVKNDSRPASSTVSSIGAQEQIAPRVGPSLAKLHVNEPVNPKHIPNNLFPHDSEVRCSATPSTAVRHPRGAESAFLSLKLLKGSKHARYYLSEESAACSSHKTSEDHGGASVEDDEANKEAMASDRTLTSFTESSGIELKSERSILDTVAVLGNSSLNEGGSKPALLTPRPSTSSQRRGAPPRAPLSQRRGASHFSSPFLPFFPSAVLRSLLSKTEGVLMRYQTALTAAMLAVQHREAVWMALQCFLHAVRKDWRSVSCQIVRGDTGGKENAELEMQEEDGAHASHIDDRHVFRSPSLSSSGTEGSRHNEEETRVTAQPQITPPPLPLQCFLRPPGKVEGGAKPHQQHDNGLDEKKENGEVPASPHLSSQPLCTTTPSISLDQILTAPSAPSHTPRPPLLLPSPSTNAKGFGAAAGGFHNGSSMGPGDGAIRSGAHSTSLSTTGNNTHRTPLEQVEAVPTVHRLTIHGLRPVAAATGGPPQGALPSMYGHNQTSTIRLSRLPQRHRPSSATVSAATVGGQHDATPLSSARGTSTLQRSQSAPRVPTVAMLSPRPPSGGRAFAVTPRARATSLHSHHNYSNNGDNNKKVGAGRNTTAAAAGGCAPYVPRCTLSLTRAGEVPRHLQPPFIRRVTVPSTLTTAVAGNNRNNGDSQNKHKSVVESSALSNVRGSAQPPTTAPTAVHDGVFSLESRPHVVPRRIYTNCLYHYLFYLQRTTLAVLEAVEVLRTTHLSYPAPFIVEHRNYLLEIVTQMSTLARDTTVQSLMHDEADVKENFHYTAATTSSSTRAGDTSLYHPLHKNHTTSAECNVPDLKSTPQRSTDPTRSLRKHTPLTSSSLSGSPFSARLSPSIPTQETEQEEERAAHRAVQVAAMRGQWPEQLLRYPLLSSHADLAPFAVTPALLRCRRTSTSSSENTTGEASHTPEQLRLPVEILEHYGYGGSNREDENDLIRHPSAVGKQRSNTAPQEKLSGRVIEHPWSAAVASMRSLPPSLQKRLEKCEVMLHREVAVALAYLRLCMQRALQHAYPLYLRGITAVHQNYVATTKKVSHDRLAWRSSTECSYAVLFGTPYEKKIEVASSAHDAARPGRLQGRHRSGHSACDTVALEDATLCARWMEELKVSWQLLMSGSSSVE